MNAGHQVLQQAAAWYALLRSERATEQDHDKWRHWHDQRAEHRHAWNLVERVGGRFGQFGDSTEKQGAMAALRVGTRGRISRRSTLLSVGGLGLASWLGWRSLAGSSANLFAGGLFADYSTRTGEHRQLQIAGGGQLWLNTQSAVDIKGAEQLRLIDGEIFLDDRNRQGTPLRIQTTFGELSARRALFNLRLGQASLCLDVYAGSIDVTCNSCSQRVQAGQQLTFGQALGPLMAAEEAHRAWVKGVMVADGMPLGWVIAELARYRHGYLACAPQIAQLSVVGTLSIRDTDRALDSLARVLPVRISRLMPWWVSLEARV